LTRTFSVPCSSPVASIAAIPQAMSTVSRIAERPRSGSALTLRTWPRQFRSEGTVRLARLPRSLAKPVPGPEADAVKSLVYLGAEPVKLGATAAGRVLLSVE